MPAPPLFRLNLLLVFALVAGRAQSGAACGEGAKPTFSVNVESVLLNVAVRDKDGSFVSGLVKNNFIVYDDGVPRQITYFGRQDLPAAIGLVVDCSGSMGPRRPEVVEAGLALIHSSNPHDKMFVVNFDEYVKLGLPSGEPFSNDASELMTALMSFQPQGRTALYDAIMLGLKHVSAASLERKALVVISDGGDNSSRFTLTDVLKRAEESNATIYTIGIYDEDDPDANPKALERLARATGGERLLPDETGKLLEACKRVARDIRAQYLIAFTPPAGSQPGAYRKIEVHVGAPGLGKLHVRARAGYREPGAAGGAGHERP